MFGKEICFHCSDKLKKVNMAKSKDGKYLCISCTGLLGRFYPGCFAESAENVLKHIEYMKKMKDVYENVFLKDDDRITVHNAGLGIVISEKHGLFKVLDEEWAEFNPQSDCELFRLDQINRFEVFNEHRENVYINNGAFVQSGVRIYMNNTLKEKYNRYRLASNQKTHPYVYMLEVLTGSEERLSPKAVNEADCMQAAYGIESILKKLMGTTKEESAAAREKFGRRADEAGL